MLHKKAVTNQVQIRVSYVFLLIYLPLCLSPTMSIIPIIFFFFKEKYKGRKDLYYVCFVTTVPRAIKFQLKEINGINSVESGLHSCYVGYKVTEIQMYKISFPCPI